MPVGVGSSVATKPDAGLPGGFDTGGGTSVGGVVAPLNLFARSLSRAMGKGSSGMIRVFLQQECTRRCYRCYISTLS